MVRGMSGVGEVCVCLGYWSIGAELLRPDALPGVNQMRGMQYKIVLNITIRPEHH